MRSIISYTPTRPVITGYVFRRKAVPLSSEAACYDSQTRLRKVTALPPLPIGRATLASVGVPKNREKESDKRKETKENYKERV